MTTREPRPRATSPGGGARRPEPFSATRGLGAEEAQRLAELWRALEPPPAAPVPVGFSRRVMTQVRETAQPGGFRGWALAGARLAGASGLVLGLIVGAGLGSLAASFSPAAAMAARAGAGRAADGAVAAVANDPAVAAGDNLDAVFESAYETRPGLAESYLTAIEAIGDGATPASGGAS